MISRDDIDSSIKEVQSLIGQKKIWVRGYGLPDCEVLAVKCSVEMVFNIDLDKELINVAPMIWCKYPDHRGKQDDVWFDKARFLKMENAK